MSTDSSFYDSVCVHHVKCNKGMHLIWIKSQVVTLMSKIVNLEIDCCRFSKFNTYAIVDLGDIQIQ